MTKKYEYEFNYNEIDDMKRYNPNFTEDILEGLTEDEKRTMFKQYYSNNLPVDLLTWMRAYEPSLDMHYRKSYWEQTVFIRDRINVILNNDYTESNLNPVKVIATHTSKSIELPVYYIYLDSYNTQIIMRGNFHDWKVSINSEYKINDIEDFVGKEKEPVQHIYCEGFEKQQVFGMYKDNNKKFTVEISYDEYKLYAFFYMIKKSLEKRNK